MIKQKKAVFLDRDGVINIDSGYIKKPEELKIYPFAAKAIKQLNNAGFLVVVVTNQSVIARNLCAESMLSMIHKKLETDLATNDAVIDAIYFCPHHPNIPMSKSNHKFVKECECRKPKPGMIFQAKADYDIDLSQSFIIGDSERDIQCGKNAGLVTIGVKTGNSVQGRVKPDVIKQDLLAAVDYILQIKSES